MPGSDAKDREWSLSDVPPTVMAAVGVLGVIFLWSYWPTIQELWKAWMREPDYSHGVLVVPIALFALWARRDEYPEGEVNPSWVGLGLIGAAVAMRLIGGLYFIGGVDGWSMVVWVAGAVWLLGGLRLLWWALPSVAFLLFMIPLPYQLETMMRLPLQRIATRFSCWILQSMGQPALSEGNTIHLGEHVLGVEQACSGLRIFVAIAVLAFAYIMLVRPAWWERLVLLLAIVPIALISNACRIVLTGMLYQFVSSEAAQKFSHDLAGWLMIPFAAALFMLVLWYTHLLIREEEEVTVRHVFQQSGG